MASPQKLDRHEQMKALQEVSKGTMDFAVDLYKVVSAKTSGNVFVSPFSIITALTMTYKGARGKTAKEMKDVLKLPDDEKLDIGYKQMLEATKDTTNVTLHTANRIYVENSLQTLDDFNKTLVEFYLSDFVKADFMTNSEKARSEMNNWVEEVTRKKITNLLPQGTIDSLTRMVLINAIYFKGDWANQFKVADTKPEPFYFLDGSQKDVDMMKMSGKEFMAGEIPELDSKILELPYKGDQLSMMIILPNQKQGLADLEAKLELLKTMNLNRYLMKRKVSITMPKFKIEETLTMNDVLKQMGMREMFSDSADFSGMSPEPLLVSKVIHKAFIEVNEEGSEAAAATGVVMSVRSMPLRPAEPITFTADHPFVFILRNRRNLSVLFYGRIVNLEN